MLENKLVQNRFFETRTFELQETGVKVTVTQLLNASSALVRYEDISLEPYEFTNFAKYPALTITLNLFAAGFFFIMAISGNPFYWLFFGISVGIFVLRVSIRRSYVSYSQGGRFRAIFLKNLPDKETFEKFVAQMQNRKKAYLRDRYLTASNPNDPGYLNTLHWLRNMGAVKQEEIENFKRDHPTF